MGGYFNEDLVDVGEVGEGGVGIDGDQGGGFKEVVGILDMEK